MTLRELEKRVAELEKTVAELKAHIAGDRQTQEPWWHTQAQRFANDPVFDEIVRLGKEYRDSLHPDRRKKKARKPKK
jgi:hypothetical protein